MLTQTKATAADYRLLPEGGKYQLIDGEIIEMPSPTLKHQKLVGTLYKRISAVIDTQQSGTLLLAPMDVHLDDENVVQPDLLFVAKAREGILQDDGVHGAPDVVIEILSPGTAYYDTKKKLLLYEKHGVREYWILDPQDNEVIGYQPDAAGKLREVCRQIGEFTSAILGTTWRFDG